MLKRLFETQRDVLRKAKIDPGGRRSWSYESLYNGIQHVIEHGPETFLHEIERMLGLTKQLRHNLMSLLDLQQKEQSVQEARSISQTAFLTAKQAITAQDQADSTDAQSRIIFVFTLVTIVFLPLSFLTS